MLPRFQWAANFATLAKKHLPGNGRQTLQHWQKHLPGMGGKLWRMTAKVLAGMGGKLWRMTFLIKNKFTESKCTNR
jgi:hypothetical protein